MDAGCHGGLDWTGFIVVVRSLEALVKGHDRVADAGKAANR